MKLYAFNKKMGDKTQHAKILIFTYQDNETNMKYTKPN